MQFCCIQALAKNTIGWVAADAGNKNIQFLKRDIVVRMAPVNC